MRILALTCFAVLAGCSTTPSVPLSPAASFFNNLGQLCGKSFAGKLVAGDDSDADFAKADMRAHVRECSNNEIRIAFDVGEDRSRTWIISAVGDGLRLKHRHILKDGTADPVSNYGGDTIDFGEVTRQEFPVDDFSKQMFVKEGRTVSTTNVWAFEVQPDASLTYELSRPNRLFRVQFDLTKPIPAAK
ncbi:MAG: hypothetical protein ABL928_01070 [Sphingorhabdus sp.]